VGIPLAQLRLQRAPLHLQSPAQSTVQVVTLALQVMSEPAPTLSEQMAWREQLPTTGPPAVSWHDAACSQSKRTPPSMVDEHVVFSSQLRLTEPGESNAQMPDEQSKLHWS
jgi:hypothetical protein